MEQPGSHAARAPAWTSPSIASAKKSIPAHLPHCPRQVLQAQREGHTGHDHRCTDANSSAAFICGPWQNQRLSWCLTPQGEMDKLLIYFTACHQPVSHPEGQQATPGDRFFGQVMKNSWEVADFTQKIETLKWNQLEFDSRVISAAVFDRPGLFSLLDSNSYLCFAL